ncbi:beclin 1-associated autophagy-related key regulator isoform X2 [Acyrthosiphon pisum]|uniref:Beclin 1-associated autophagy-related key regulator n=1 Tax=Acyrthosiphon pisum TaxID=7029 RepID=A0A8R2A3L8_ACYPI|nr:beclin 1-associated autophagy-related key regulator isoform X2 [Acyrthosiphon pisum]|eukprot:XP_001945788.2 PREDICTED: beclin 1-associated autophagy-related key regulator isoform X2 [Acyrthosiphon pisum]
MDRPSAIVPVGHDTTPAAAPAPVPGGSSKGFGVPGCRKTSQKWCYGTEQCPMCHRFRKLFHCKTCVLNGDFGHSSAAFDKGRFFKKQMKFQSIVYNSNLFKNDCAKMFSKRQCTTLKKTETSILQEKIRLLKLALSDKNKILTDKKNQLKKIKLEIDNQKSRVDRYRSRVVRLEDFTKGQSSALNDKKNELFAVRPSLKNIIQTRINQLVTHIFSLNEVHPTILHDRNEGLDVSNNLSHALAEASKLTYVCGQWVDTCEEWSRQTELGYRIVAPTLPANGDYSAYNEWVSDKNRDYAFHQTFIEPNPACTISAALTYTSQLVKQISFFIDVFLPRRPNFSEFCGNELNETKFAKYVTHLNANILYLCFSQNVDPKLLHPDHTLKNLLQLLDTSVSDLGRVDPPDIDSKLCNAFEDKIAFQLFSFTGDSDSEEDNYYEWEAVPNVEYLADQNQLSSQSASSVVRAGLVASTAASLASMWRGWTK